MNPFTFVIDSLDHTFRKPTPDSAPIVQLARRYLRNWESMFETKTSEYEAIRRPASAFEKEIARDSVRYLGELALSLNPTDEDFSTFERQLSSEVARIASPIRFADGSHNEFAANSICMATTLTVFNLRDMESPTKNDIRIEAIGSVIAAILFSFMRYADWLEQQP